MECGIGEELESLQTKMMLLQNKNHALANELEQMQNKYENEQREHRILEQQYDDVLQQLKQQEHNRSNIAISRRQTVENEIESKWMMECIHLFSWILDKEYIAKSNDVTVDMT